MRLKPNKYPRSEMRKKTSSFSFKKVVVKNFASTRSGMCRNITLVLLFHFFVVSSLHAQLEKGTLYFGGSMNFKSQKERSEQVVGNNQSNYSDWNYGVSPEFQFGYFRNKSTAIGLGVRHSFSSDRRVLNDKDDMQLTVNRSVELMPFVRKYKSLSDNWSLFLHAEVAPRYNFRRVRSEGLNELFSSDSYWTYALSIRPGLVYLLPKKKWAIEGYLNLLALTAKYAPSHKGQPRQFSVDAKLSNPILHPYFSLRIARYILTKKSTEK